MDNIFKGLGWAAAILVAAYAMTFTDLSTGASFGVIAGLSGAALASLRTGGGCGRSCLQ